MPDILHRVAIKATPADIYDALTKIKPLSRWWATDTSGDSGTVGGIVHFQFGDRGFIEMKIVALDAARHVSWEVVVGPDAWIGTHVNFELRPNDDVTVLLFSHVGWQETSEFMHHCTTKWGTFLMSLKAALETGHGAPFPDDIQVSYDWG